MPTPVPTILTMNAVMIPTWAPSHHPIPPPIVAPTILRSFDILYISILRDIERDGIDP